MQLHDRIDFISKVYADLQNMISFADTKANLSISIQSILISFGLGFSLLINTIQNLFTLNQILLNILFFAIVLLFVGFSILGIIFSVMVYKARSVSEAKEKTKGLIYFGHISQFQSSKDYLAELKAIEEEQLLEEYSQQVYILSHIAKEKMKFVNRSIYCLIASLLLIVILLLFSGYISSLSGASIL